MVGDKGAVPGLIRVGRAVTGVGYLEGDGQIRSWIGTGFGEWHRLYVDYQMAMEAVMNTDKGGNILVLGAGRVQQHDDTEQAEIVEPLVAGMSVAPNPFNPQTQINFTLPHGGAAKLRIFDIRGRHVRTVIDEYLTPGVYEATWRGQDDGGRRQASGVYFAVLQAGDVRFVRRMLLMK